jgi:cobalamin biosynthesis Mg chelatase CobN
MTSTLKALAGAALVAGLLVVASAQPAAAATPCWKTLLNDWYDGRIDNVYPVHCYQDTLKHLPPDVSVYSSARDDILRALQSAKDKLEKKETVTPNTPVPAQATTTSPEQSGTTTTAAASGGKSGSGGNGGTGAPKSPDAGGGTSTAGSPGRQTDKGLSGVAQQLNTSSPSSVPVPLIVLGGLAVLLVAAGAAGLIAKRMHSRTPGS